MDRVRGLAIVSLVVVAVVAGGSLVRLALAAGDPQVAATLGLVGLLAVAAVLVGARSRRWLENPYW